jgi:hypothetical protein
MRNSSSPPKKTAQLHYKSKNQEFRNSIPPSPLVSDSSRLSWSGILSEAGNSPHYERETRRVMLRHPDQKPRIMLMSPSVPLLFTSLAPYARETDELGDTIYKCVPVEQGKKHPSPTKVEWEDMTEKWQSGVMVRTRELCV